jgi:hypothetical protein
LRCRWGVKNANANRVCGGAFCLLSHLRFAVCDQPVEMLLMSKHRRDAKSPPPIAPPRQEVCRPTLPKCPVVVLSVVAKSVSCKAAARSARPGNDRQAAKPPPAQAANQVQAALHGLHSLYSIMHIE